jgi:hypothetical protein
MKKKRTKVMGQLPVLSLPHCRSRLSPFDIITSFEVRQKRCTVLVDSTGKNRLFHWGATVAQSITLINHRIQRRLFLVQKEAFCSLESPIVSYPIRARVNRL